MRKLIFGLSLFSLAIAVTGLGLREDLPSPDGKMLIVLENVEGTYNAISITVVQGASPSPLKKGNAEYRIINAGGGTITTGQLYIPRYIYHCKPDESGMFTGYAESIHGSVVVTLPYYRSAEILELRDEDGRMLSHESIRNVPIRKPFAPQMMFNKDENPPDFRGYLKAMTKVPEPLEPGIATSKRSVAAAGIKVDGKVKVNGQGVVGSYSASIYFYKNDNDKYVTGTSYTSLGGDFSVNLEPGSYLARVYCWYYDPDFGGNAVQLYPFPQIVPDIRIGSTEPPKILNFTFNLNNLFIGKVKAEGGGSIPANVYILDNKKAKSIFQRGFLGPINTDAAGKFAIRLPSRNYAFVVVPRYQDAAGELLTIKSVKSGGKTQEELNCPAPGKVKGASLKQIWPSNLAGPPGTAPTGKGKLNILFMAEAYTKKKEPFTDSNGNGRWDGDLLLDENGNGRRDPSEYYYDRNANNQYNVPEKFKDKNKDGICNRYERAKFELDCLMNTAALLNIQPFKKNAKRINVYTYWVASKHGVQRFTKSQPWKNMKTYFGSSCNSSGGFQSGSIDSAKVYRIAASVLPDYTVPVVMVHDPFNAMRSNAMFNFGRVLQSAEDTRGGATLIHELGHSIGNLGDEYVYNEGSTYSGGEPDAVNLTKETNPNNAKWRKYIKGSPPVPTPFGYDGYGIFEGGAYGSYGIYRPTATSMMRSTSFPFFKVNEARLKKVLKAFKK